LVWTDPRYRYASDEDVSWANGHAADPRVEQGDLTNDPLGWCAMRLAMYRDQMRHLNERFPMTGDAFGAETDAFAYLWRQYGACAQLPSHFLGGQYLSRAHRGDPHAEPLIVPVSRADQKRAFDLLERNVFAADALPLPPSLVARLTYSEWAGYSYDFPTYGNLPQFLYDPPERHDTSLTDLFGTMQASVLRQMFQPLVLARIVDAPSETADPHPMRLVDLFTWMHRAVYREFSAGTKLAAIAPLRAPSNIATSTHCSRSRRRATPSCPSTLARSRVPNCRRSAAKLRARCARSGSTGRRARTSSF